MYVCSFHRLFRFFELTVFGCSLIQFASTCQVIDREDRLRYDHNVLSGTLNFQPTNHRSNDNDVSPGSPFLVNVSGEVMSNDEQNQMSHIGHVCQLSLKLPGYNNSYFC